MASAFQVLHDWLDVDVSFQFDGSGSTYVFLGDFIQQHSRCYGNWAAANNFLQGEILQKNDKKCFRVCSSNCAHSLYVALSFNAIKCLERLCLYSQRKVWFSGTSISEIIYCLRWSALGWRLEKCLVHDECGAPYARTWTAFILYGDCINAQQKTCILRVCILNTIDALLCASFIVYILFHFISVFPTAQTNRPYKSVRSFNRQTFS